MSERWYATLFVLGITGLACGAPPEEEVGAAEQAAVEQRVAGTLPERSLVVTDPEILARFDFGRTMSRIRASALSTGQSYAQGESRLAIYQRWMRSFGDRADGCRRGGVDPNGYGLVCPRPDEALLATIDPFAADASVRFRPVGLFNRLDLAPANGRTCGEYRIVYAMDVGPAAPLAGRAFIIFEGALPNPTPSLGIDACLPVARFWQALSNDPNVTSRAKKLEAFYFGGTAVPGFGPAISAANYGLASDGVAAIAGRPGQIRTNFFVNFREWHLREFKLRKSCPTPTTCVELFVHSPVKSNPAEELFAGTHARSPELRAAFPAQVAKLAAADLNGIAMTTSNTFNEAESVSQRLDVVYQNSANGTMRTVIRNELTRIGSPLTVRNILDRATTQTCAGCHQVSVGASLGGGLTWPGTLFFVHIDEASNLSPALQDVFLPHRRTVLEAFINDREGLIAPLDPETSLSGRPADAPN